MAELTTIPYNQISEESEQNEIASKAEDGTVKKRKKFTRTRKIFSIKTALLSPSEKTILKDLYDLKGTIESFEWTNLVDNNTYTVRFKKPFKIVKSSQKATYFDEVSFELEEV